LNAKVRSSADTANFYNLAFNKYMDAAFDAGASGVMFWGWGVSKEQDIPMWWAKESHNIEDEKFCAFLKKYIIPSP